MESNRQRKVAQIIQEDFAELFRKQASESKQNFLVSVSDVKITPDLGIAKIYLSIFPQEFRSSIMKEIEANKAQYRNFIGQKMARQVRIIPQLNFYLDTTLDDVEKIEKEFCSTNIHYYSQKQMYSVDFSGFNIKYEESEYGNNKLKILYESVIKFINFYNKQKEE